MRRGVAVVAAADGEVLIARDGQPDRPMREAGPGKTVDQRNGNWVAVRHGDGWVTTYAHMLKGSVAVRAGQRVARGDRSEEHTSELQSLMRITYAVFCLKKKKEKSS